MLPNEREPDSTEKSLRDESSASAADRLSDEGSGRPASWSLGERRRLLLWVVIGFLPAGLLIWILRPVLTHGGSEFTIQSELPTKAIAAFFMVLATWIVSRIEKRPLADYGIPPNQEFGTILGGDDLGLHGAFGNSAGTSSNRPPPN
jgi:hypothetical protein